MCNNRKRSGSIKLTLLDFPSKKWKDAGAVLQIDYNSYKVVRASDNKGIQFDGTHLLTNVSGGNWLTILFLPAHANLVHKVTGTDLKVTFDDGKIAKWNINRQYTYSYSMNGTTPVITCAGEGLGTQNGISQLENWGTTRDGDAFTSQIVENVVWNTTCGAHAPVTGKINIKVDAKEFELTSVIGVDVSGNPVTPAVNTCPYGLKVSWIWKTKTGSKIYPYQ